MSVGNLSSIAPYLPLQVNGGSLRWKNSAEYGLKAVARGPGTSHVNNSLALYDSIEDIRTENGDLEPLSSHVAVGLNLLCRELEDTEEFFNSTLPDIAKLALKLPDLLEHHEREIQRLSDGIPSSMILRVLSPQQSGLVLLHQHLIAALLACGFLCLYPQNREQKKLGLVNINFDGLYLGAVHAGKSNLQKLLCLVHYFRKVGRNMPDGTVSFERKVLPLKNPSLTESLSVPNGSFWSDSKKPLCQMKVIKDGAIEHAGLDYLKVDFANEQLGGGALYTGCVQEEICFMVNPECIAGMLFLPTLTDNESIEITGAETYSQYSGYGRSFCFAGDHIDDTPRDSWGRRKNCIGAIDALCLPGESQFEDELMIRELNKAYCGFLNHSALCGYDGSPDLLSTGNIQVPDGGTLAAIEDSQEYRIPVLGQEVYDEGSLVRNTLSNLNRDNSLCQESSREPEPAEICNIHQKLSGVATGNWGSGAFGGNLQLKSLLQWLAASQAGCTRILYYSFGDSRSERLQEVIDWIRQEDWCVSELWSMVQRYGKCRIHRQVRSELYEWILPHENTESFILRSKTVRFTSSPSQRERENYLMQTSYSGRRRRQLIREVAPRKKASRFWACCRWQSKQAWFKPASGFKYPSN